MLLEYIGPMEIFRVERRGVTLRFQAQDQYGGAKVLDVNDQETAQELLRSRGGVPLAPQFQVFWMEPLRDPDFVRYLVRYPVSARKVLDHLDQYPEDPAAIAEEVRQASDAKIQTWAAELGISDRPVHALRELILAHYRRLWPDQPEPAPVLAPVLAVEPEKPVEAATEESPAPTRKKGGRPKKAA